MLVSAPVHLDFELQVVKTGLTVLDQMIGTKEDKGMFSTSLAFDLSLLKEDMPWRKYCGLTYRITQKEVL